VPLEKHINDITINENKKEFYLTDIVEIFKGAGEKVETVSCPAEDITGVNSRKELAIVNNILNKRVLEKFMASGVTIMDPGSTFIDESVEIGADTVIYPCTVIEKDVKIAGKCKIGPFSHIRPGSRVLEEAEIGNYVELCRSVVGERSRVKHHTYLGDTVVGKDVNIGAGTITANYDGKDKHPTVIEDECFIGVGVSLIAPVRVGKGAKIGAGSVVTKNKNVPPGSVVAGVPAKILKN
jgi:bifunctional UDP-N-acetylglucosamine pyrophosphorylase/glucosamine-1-phosphate N-acetyltransferase